MSSRAGRIGGIMRTRRTFARATERASSAEAHADAEAEARHWQDLAPRLGWCGHCGCHVDEANGVLHAHDCPYLPQGRRRPA